MKREAKQVPIPQVVARARKAAVPVVAIATADPIATERAIKKHINGKGAHLHWDIVRGLTPADNNDTSREAFAVITGPLSQADIPIPVRAATTNVTQMLALLDNAAQAESSTGRVIVYLHLANRYLSENSVVQGIANIRDSFSGVGWMAVLLGIGFDGMPEDLRQSILILDEELPDAEELGEIVDRVAADAETEIPADTRTVIVDQLRGLSTFAAEQSLALALDPQTKEVDLDELWRRKKAEINRTPGLKVDDETMTFADLRGVDGLEWLGKRIKGAKRKALLAIRLDEIEKMFPGNAAGGGDGGVALDRKGVVLKEMEDNRWKAVCIAGPGGSGKTAWCKAIGNELGCPSIAMDLPGMQSKWVGESEARIRNAFKVIRAIAGQRVLIVGTCNGLETLDGALRRRFTYGIWMCDLPSKEARAEMWTLYMRKYGLGGEAGPLPFDADWTGAEIRNCCEAAEDFGVTLKEAARTIVPIAQSDAEAIKRLRDLATAKKFICAARGTPYIYTKEAPVASSRRIGRNKED